MNWLARNVISPNNKDSLINCVSKMSRRPSSTTTKIRALLASDWEDYAFVRWAAQILVGALPGLVILFTIMHMASGAPRQSIKGTSAASIVPLLSASTLADSAAFHRVAQVRTAASDEVMFRLPGSAEQQGPRKRVLTVVKRTSPINVNFKTPRQNWKHLNAGTRQAIDAGLTAKHSWQRVVMHGSGASHGSAGLLDRYHSQVRGLSGGLGYHFVIGNGAGAGDGAVQSGARWAKAMPVDNGTVAEGSISVCFVGDFQSQAPTVDQLEAFDELIDYLSLKLGHLPVITHGSMVGGESRCLGAKFPVDQVLRELEH